LVKDEVIVDENAEPVVVEIMKLRCSFEAAKTEKERRQGKPGKTPMSIRKFLEYNDE